ncbi:Mur ligase domain-containing protein [Tepidimicrobium xylanilyticum]
MKLIDIIKNSKYEVLKGNLGMDISGIEHDSRKVTKGNMFIAINGFTVDGHNYIGEAIEKGANCIVVEKDVPIVECNITVIKVPSTTDALAQYAAKYYEEPSKKNKNNRCYRH